MSEYDCVLIKLYFQKQMVGQIGPMDGSLPAPDTEEYPYIQEITEVSGKGDMS